MDSPPPPCSRSHSARSKPKSLSRLSRSIDTDSSLSLSLDLTTLPSLPPPVNSRSPPRQRALPLQELLLLSPCKPRTSSRSRLADRLDAADELARRARRRDGGHRQAVASRGSPRKERRSQRLLVAEGREEKGEDDFGKVRRRKRSGVHRKEKENRLSIVPMVNMSSSLSPWVVGVDDDGEHASLDRIGQVISDLVMWRDVAKSTLWFGLGCACFLSSCFARGISLSIFSVMSQIGLLFLGLAFFSNSLSQRSGVERKRDFKLKEEDVIRIARLVRPSVNLLISMTRELFSGEPSMTLKVAPFLLMGAEYGHLITFRRLCAIGFFASFTIPKLYSCYVTHINRKVEFLKRSFFEKWNGCTYKKIVGTSAIMAFWNLTSMKTRIITAFISIVMVRYYRQQSLTNYEAVAEAEKEEQPKALVISKDVSKE